ncbi:hypothetical protein XENOCAPTIV_018848 [Xenoophorus captivus]|uniref:Uncharacterized protein n=1 Tax=Xenoophorus captivus TaxID=1517983 RepID=A0ABV0S1S7_9TELE
MTPDLWLSVSSRTDKTLLCFICEAQTVCSCFVFLPRGYLNILNGSVTYFSLLGWCLQLINKCACRHRSVRCDSCRWSQRAGNCCSNLSTELKRFETLSLNSLVE